MRRYRIAANGAGRSSAVALGLGLAICLAIASTARAGTWMQVSCVNPDGSAAPSEGWSGYPQGSVNLGSDNRATCSPGTPLQAFIANSTTAADGAREVLQYTPPSGSKLIGGRANVVAGADGSGPYARGAVGMYEPQLASDESNAFFGCVYGLGWCNGGNDYSGTVSLPADRGGALYVAADCRAAAGNCDTGGSNGAYAWIQVSEADLLLQSAAAPQAASFGGSALQPRVHGTAHLVFTASEQDGPGVYAVTVALDGRPVYSGTPSANGGACVSRGTDPGTGALMFDNQQPCLSTEVVDVAVPTAGLPDGTHQLTASVIDAAQNASTVMDRTIHTVNPEYTPVARRGVRAQFLISWHWLGKHTTLRSLKVRRLPANARVSVRCRGRTCPKLKVRSAPARRIKRLLRALGGKRFTRGDKLLITVSAPRRASERVELTILNDRKPRARLVKP